MGIRIEVAQPGDVSVLRAVNIEPSEPAAGQVWVEHDAIGVNFLDVTQRNGAVPLSMPGGIGVEAAGRVARVGPGVTHVKTGDRVGYVLGAPGSYATGRMYPAQRLIKLPDSLASVDAASVLMKGITAHYMLTTTYAVGSETIAVIYGAAGALGQIMVPWARALGATVIGVVSRESSVARALKSGCNAVLVWGKDDIPAEVARLTAGRKAHVVYDGVGKATFEASLDSLGTRGLLVSIGASSGAPPAVAVSALNSKGSLYLTRPSLAAHATDIEEYRRRADAVFEAIAAGIIRP